MNLNYYYLWNYNKLPFVYSIMKKNENNILIINIQDSPRLECQLSHLIQLEKIQKVILVKNNIFEYIGNLLYRLFIFPFLSKTNRIVFYLDGFVGYYPIYLANLGVPSEVNFYEEGESIYYKDVLFRKTTQHNLKQKINELIKRTLLIKKNSILDITSFYVRDKQRMLQVLFTEGFKNYNFRLYEVNDVDCVKNLPDSDKRVIDDIFFSAKNFKLSNDDVGFKKAIVLTQPTYLFGIHTKQEAITIFNTAIEELKEENYKVYLKLHPKENEDIYSMDGVQRLNGDFPFEFLAIYDIQFDKGVSYNSTAINSNLIKEKVFLKDN